ncbi:unnamed protein product [Arabidopsis lyrata]|uniref:uncharacterized acetyltransferase At3g50280 n=1 Tax=Arabidopsis lyrata subsp. lyrata TaxID=81972 RepID=UPI000A29DB85|nr:uncharacterized acetyltransferase At3g50280 [Arabidopsis lyrata subsp. lyrata]CAH8270414.1 unnamed protein product [Arabidopsis lyrata]|eukprot:XP_020878725.1 uncharacterized acetyltransferase At3g50280 [Arabidopsis lyrata subsp. lyrata]
MDSPSSEVKIVSQCFVKPKTIPEKWKEPYHLSPLDLVMLSMHYLQNGLLFLKPSMISESDDAIKTKDFMETLLQKLRDSLAETLVHFYPLAGRLSTLKTDNPRSYSVFVDCNDSPGAGFIRAKSDLSVRDIVESKYVPLVVQSFFDHHKAVSHDGHTMSLFSVKVTELVDGVFIGLSLNHAVGDGGTLWHFFNSLSEIFNAHETDNLLLKNPPVLSRWFPKGYGPVYSLPFTHSDEFISRFESPVLKERIFHFSSETITSLKSKANQECRTTTISSFQALTAFIWRCITRARKLPYDHEIRCSLAANNGTKLDPPLPLSYFGNCISAIKSKTVTSSELLENDLGWAALKMHKAVIGNTSEEVSATIENWMKSSYVFHLEKLLGAMVVHIGSSPRFKMYECEFGMGKAVAVRSGYGGKFDGKISAYAGREGGGSIDLEVCLLPEFMEALESDQEFMSRASSSS